jgi:hypothetical protein
MNTDLHGCFICVPQFPGVSVSRWPHIHGLISFRLLSDSSAIGKHWEEKRQSMKNHISNLFLSSLVLAAGLEASALPARAGYLITIDETDPYNVVIAGTGAVATNGDAQFYYNGVNLVNFFTSEAGANSGGWNFVAPAPTLCAALNPLTSASYDPYHGYVWWGTDRYIAGSYVDLNLLSPQGSPWGDQFQPFAPGQPAFTGTNYFDLSSKSLPAYGTHGPIYVGGSFGAGFTYPPVPIGEWIVIAPVPPPPPPPPLPDMTIGSLLSISPTEFGFSIGGSNGVNYTVQYLTNLASTNWQTLTSFTVTTNPFPVVDSNATNATRYYRLLKN